MPTCVHPGCGLITRSMLQSEAMLSRLFWRRYLRRNGYPISELDQFRTLSPQQQQHVLARKLLDQIHYFGAREDALPEWKEAARIRRPEDLWRHWPDLPILNKQALRIRFAPAEMQARFRLSGRVDATGGSTGEPTRFFHDWPMLRASTTLIYYTNLRMGWQPGMAMLCVWGSERDIGKSLSRRVRLHHALLRYFLLDGYRLSDETVDRFLALVKRHRPVAAYGFTTMLAYLAERILARGIEIPPGWVKTAWNGGEMLYDDAAAVFQKAFGVPLLNRYGGRELSTMACQFEAGGPLWVMRPWLFLEIVDEHGKPVSPGQSGRLIWTSTICRGTPFLRYDIEDLGASALSLQDESGICGISQLQGRTAGLIELPDGRKINNIYWNHLFKEFPEVRQFQVVVRGATSFRLLLKGTGFTPEREAHLRGILQNFLGNFRLEDIRWVEEIPRTSQGKLIQVVRESA